MIIRFAKPYTADLIIDRSANLELSSLSKNKCDYSFVKSNNFTCSSCGLRSRPHKISLTGFIEKHIESSGDEYALCVMCRQSIYLNRGLNGEYAHGRLIYWPDMSQSKICQLAQMCFVQMVMSRSNDSSHAHILDRRIKSDLTSNYGKFIPGLSSGDIDLVPDVALRGSIAEYVELYSVVKPEERNTVEPYFTGLRYWPDFNTYMPLIKYWMKSTWNNLECIDMNSGEVAA